MSASDHLSPQQFMTLYHGTTADNAASIQREGFRPATGHIFPAKWPTLTESRQAADAYASPGEYREAATVEMHVPIGEMDRLLWPAQEHMGGAAYAVKRHVPAAYVHAVHPVTEHVDYPA